MISGMGWWRRLGARVAVALSGAEHTFSEPAPRPIDQVILDMTGRVSGGRVSRSAALTVPAVQRGRNMICSISTLPLCQYDANNRPITNPLLVQLDRDVANVVTLAQTLEDLLFESIAWWRIVERDGAGFPTKCQHLDVGMVSVNPPGTGTAPLPSGVDPRGESVVWVNGQKVSASNVIRFDSPNPPVLSAGAKAIRRAILLDSAASMYADDPRPLDYFTPSDGADEVDDDEVKDILARWKAARKKRSTAWVPRAMKYNSVDTPSPAELQLVELQKQASLDIANALGIDPEDLGVSTTSRTYTNAIDRRRDRINDVLSPYMLAITQRLSMGDVTRRNHRVIFDLDDYLRANPTERWAVYGIAIDKGVMSPEEVRAEENMPPGAPKPKPAPAPLPQPEDVVIPSDASALAGYGFSAGEGSTWTADAEHVSAQFTVDTTRRTITGLALPYGVVGRKYGLKFAFLRGSIKWNGSAVSRVKLLRDHDSGQAIGYAVALKDTPNGLMTSFKVAKGTAGDEALSLAAEGVLDGLSVGVDFDMSQDTAMDDNGVMLVQRADLRETSLTAMPLFDDARVTKVAASRTNPEGTHMDPCQQCGQTHAAGVACAAPNPPANQIQATAGLALNAEQISALLAHPGALQALVTPQAPAAPATPAGGLTLSREQLDAIIAGGGLGVLLGVPHLTPAPAAPERPEVVDPTRRLGATGPRPTTSTSVTEPLPYRFDREGNLTKGETYDFSRDLVAGSQGDGEAMTRASMFLQAMSDQFVAGPARAQFDVDTTDAAPLNPNRQRPDMYVDQKDFAYPIWDAINKGTLADMTPFVLPKFSSATGLVAAHVQGVEPTPGTFVATSQTITPSAVSGKVEITREAWDQGGNPQLSGIIWRQMQKSWFEALEASAVTLLDGLTPTGITLTTAAVDDQLTGELEAAIAALQFVRGGMSMRDLFLQVDLYKALAAAVDGDGRKLLPMLGAVNANGTVSELFADLNIAGLRGRPAWALAASGTVAASSYLFDRANVHGWATAPQRLQFEYRVAYVDVAIWGYKATASTDDTGIREVIYDPQ
jgi:HK97 family phage prohead protease